MSWHNELQYLKGALASSLQQMVAVQARPMVPAKTPDDVVDKLRNEVRRGGDTEKLVEAIALVMDARDTAQGNVNPQLLAAVLAHDLGGVRRA